MRSLLAVLLTAVPAAAGSGSLMDVTADGSRLAVANPDSGTVTVVDLKARTVVCELPAGDHPEGVAWAGPLVLATVYGDDRVVFLDPAAKAVAHVLPVDDEPYAVVVTRDGTTAYVSHDYPGTVSVLDVPGRRVRGSWKVGDGCRGLALSNDEKTLYVTEFHTGTLRAIDTGTGRVVSTWPGSPSDNLARSVTLHPTRAKAYLPLTRSKVASFSATASLAPVLACCDLDKSAGDRRRSVPLDAFNGAYVIATPAEVAVSPDGRTLYAVYAGTNDGNVAAVIDDDYKEAEPVGRPVQLGKHPRAVRVRPDGGEVYVYNALDFEVAVYDRAMRSVLARVPVTTPPHSAAWRRGKELFATARQPMSSERWVSCANCHPDGLHDGRTWQNPEGPRRTPVLFGLAHTHPLHWSADRDEVHDFEHTVRGKLMLGRGLVSGRIDPDALGKPLGGTSADLDALAVYTNSFPLRLSPHPLTAEAERGKALFFDAKTGCATCHSGPYYTDSSLAKPFKLHDVGTGGGPGEKLGPAFDTPSLLWAYRAGTYLHDGRAKSLAEVLTTHNRGDKHGATSHLSAGQVGELVSFLKALPDEPPPADTPNAVRFRETLRYPRPPGNR
jgi:YVTN family beta-propeller protein